MAIRLTTPLSPGAFDNVRVYNHCRIFRVTIDMNRSLIILNLNYGTFSGRDWVPGRLSPVRESIYPSTFVLEGETYATFVGEHASNDGEMSYAALKRGFYELLQSLFPALAGTLV